MAKAAKAIKMMGSPMAEQAAENTRQWLKWLPVGNHPKNHALTNAVQTALTWKPHSGPIPKWLGVTMVATYSVVPLWGSYFDDR